MVTREIARKEKVEYTGLMDFAGIYSFAHNWLRERGYGVNEDKYSEKKEKNVRNIEIEWLATKKIADDLKIEYKIKFLISELVDVEVEIEKIKRIMNKGKLSIDITGTLAHDPESKWEGSFLLTFWKAISDLVIGSEIERAKRHISREVVNLKEEIKAYLELIGIR